MSDEQPPGDPPSDEPSDPPAEPAQSAPTQAPTKKRKRKKPAGSGGKKGSRQRATSEHGLTEFEERFAVEYLRHRNYAEAARAAGSTAKTTAGLRTVGYLTFHKPAVGVLIEKLKAEAAASMQLGREDVLAAILRIANKAEDAGRYVAALRGHQLYGAEALGMTFGTSREASVKTAIAQLLEAAAGKMKPEAYAEFSAAVRAEMAEAGLGEETDPPGREPGSVH